MTWRSQSAADQPRMGGQWAKLRCVNAHDRCYECFPCPCCELTNKTLDRERYEKALAERLRGAR